MEHFGTVMFLKFQTNIFMNQSNVFKQLCKQPKHKHRKGTNSVATSKVSISKSQTQYIFQNMKVTHPVLVPNNCSEPRLPADDGAFAVPHHTPMEVGGCCLIIYSAIR